jgi:hypothetical protein
MKEGRTMVALGMMLRTRFSPSAYDSQHEKLKNALVFQGSVVTSRTFQSIACWQVTIGTLVLKNLEADSTSAFMAEI